MEALSRACPSDVKEAGAALADQVLSMTPAIQLFQIRHLVA
jgi:hypothetical protein